MRFFFFKLKEGKMKQEELLSGRRRGTESEKEVVSGTSVGNHG